VAGQTAMKQFNGTCRRSGTTVIKCHKCSAVRCKSSSLSIYYACGHWAA